MHTQWTIGSNAPDYHGRVTIRDSEGWEVAQIPGLPIDMPHPKQDAVARLIKQAPAMLAVLEEILPYLEQVQGKDEQWQIVSDVIAQVKGA